MLLYTEALQGLATLSHDYTSSVSRIAVSKRMSDVDLSGTMHKIINMVASLMACPHGLVSPIHCLIS